jgi:hypothetical protein
MQTAPHNGAGNAFTAHTNGNPKTAHERSESQQDRTVCQSSMTNYSNNHIPTMYIQKITQMSMETSSFNQKAKTSAINSQKPSLTKNRPKTNSHALFKTNKTQNPTSKSIKPKPSQAKKTQKSGQKNKMLLT